MHWNTYSDFHKESESRTSNDEGVFQTSFFSFPTIETALTSILIFTRGCYNIVTITHFITTARCHRVLMYRIRVTLISKLFLNHLHVRINETVCGNWLFQWKMKANWVFIKVNLIFELFKVFRIGDTLDSNCKQRSNYPQSRKVLS